MFAIKINGAGVWTGESVELPADSGVPAGYVAVTELPTVGAGQYAVAVACGRVEVRTGTPPAPYVEKVTRRQFLQGLTRIGLRGQVTAWRAALDPDDPADLDLIDWYDESQYFERANPELLAVAAAFGLSDAQIDAAFALMVSL